MLRMLKRTSYRPERATFMDQNVSPVVLKLYMQASKLQGQAWRNGKGRLAACVLRSVARRHTDLCKSRADGKTGRARSHRVSCDGHRGEQGARPKRAYWLGCCAQKAIVSRRERGWAPRESYQISLEGWCPCLFATAEIDELEETSRSWCWCRHLRSFQPSWERKGSSGSHFPRCCTPVGWDAMGRHGRREACHQ